jgi:hypothetical protein
VGLKLPFFPFFFIFYNPAQAIIDSFIFDDSLSWPMADALSTYMITVGVFVFLVGILFGARDRRPRGEPTTMPHTESG